MTYHQIHCFLEVAELKSFTRASEALNLSQPAISRIITAMENELGIRLFERNKDKPIALTPAGKDFYSFFNKFMMEFKKLLSEYSMENGKKVRIYQLGYPSGWSITNFYDGVVNQFHQLHPDSAIEIISYDLNLLKEKLLSGDLDFILCFNSYIRETKSVSSRKIVDLPRLVLYSDVCIEKYGNFTKPSDFSGIPFLIPSACNTESMAEDIKNVMEKNGIDSIIEFHSNMDNITTLVENGSGVTMFDAWSRNLKMGGFHSMPLEPSHSVMLSFARVDNYRVIDDLVQIINKNAFLQKKSK